MEVKVSIDFGLTLTNVIWNKLGILPAKHSGKCMKQDQYVVFILGKRIQYGMKRKENENELRETNNH